MQATGNQQDQPGGRSKIFLLLSIPAAFSLSLLIILAFWHFELRSLVKLSYWSLLLMVAIWPPLYFFFYRKIKNAHQVNFTIFLIGFLTSALFAFQVTPYQGSFHRDVLAFLIVGLAFFVFHQTFLVLLMKRWDFDLRQALLALVLVGSAAGLAILFINSFSARVYADDFCYAVDFHNRGLWGSSLWFYLNWSARFFSNFLVMGFSRQLGALTFFLVLCLFSPLLLLLELFRESNNNRWLIAISGAFFITFTTFTITPDLDKSLYWTGSAMVVLPLLVMIPLYLLLLSRCYFRRRIACGWGGLLIAFLLSFAITTSHEVASLGWLGMHILMLAVLFWSRSRNKRLRNLLMIGLLAAILGLVLLVTSPGAAARAAAQHYPVPPPIFEAVRLSFSGLRYLLSVIDKPYYPYHGDFRAGWLLLAAAAGFGWLLEAPWKRHFLAAFLALIGALGMALVSFFPGAYAMSNIIPLRSMLTPTYFLVLGAFFFGLLLPQCSGDLAKKAFIFLVALLVAFGAWTTINQWRLTMEPMRRYARDWDARDQKVRETGEIPQRIPIPWDEYEQEIECIKLYYRTFK